MNISAIRDVQSSAKAGCDVNAQRAEAAARRTLGRDSMMTSDGIELLIWRGKFDIAHSMNPIFTNRKAEA